MSSYHYRIASIVAVFCLVFGLVVSTDRVQARGSSALRTRVVPQTLGQPCNKAPNAAFEQGTSSTINNWTLVPFSGAASLIAVNNGASPTYPVQSGARAALVHVTQAGSIYFTNIPETTGISVLPGRTYTAAARLYSTGHTARLWLLEWNSAGGLVGQHFSPLAGQLNTWVPVQVTFPATSATTYISMRLLMDQGTGDYVWDDPLLWDSTVGSTPYLCADMRHYITQSTPGFKLCTTDGRNICIVIVQGVAKGTNTGAGNSLQ